MRVLFTNYNAYLPEFFGGIETNTHALCEHLLRAGWDCAVVAKMSTSGALSLMRRGLGKISSTLCRWPDHNMGYPVYRSWAPDAAGELDRVVSRFHPEIAVVQNWFPMDICDQLAKRGVPSAIYLHDVSFRLFPRPIAPARHLTVISNSQYTAEKARLFFGTDSTVIYPLIDPWSYRSDGPRDRAVLINPAKRKGVDLAWALAEALPSIPFMFVGGWGVKDHDHWHALDKRARALGNVTLEPAVMDMRQIYRRARVVMMPSDFNETWGRVATEAQVSGIPILASTEGALAESVGSGGVLLPLNAGVAVWAQALTRLWRDEPYYRQLSDAASRYAQRVEIQPTTLAAKFMSVLDHHRRLAAG